MKHWKVILAAGLIFASGVITGALALRSQQAPTHRGMPSPPVDARADALQQMQVELSLTAEQSVRIDAILQEGRKRMRRVWDTCQPEMREEMKRVRERIQAELDDAQRDKYDRLLKRSKSHRGYPSDNEGTGGPRPHSERDR